MKQKTITFALVLLVSTVGIVGIGINNVSATQKTDKYEYTRDNPSPKNIEYPSIQEYSTFNQNNGKIINYDDFILELGFDKLMNERKNRLYFNTSNETILKSQINVSKEQIDSNNGRSNKLRFTHETLSSKRTVYSSINQYSTFQDYENNKNQEYEEVIKNLGFEKTQ